MAKQRKVGSNTIGEQLATAATPKVETPKTTTPKTTIFTLGKKYRVKSNTKHAHDKHWDLMRARLLDGPANFDELAKLGETVHKDNCIPYVRYCARRGWIVEQTAE